MCSCVSSSCHVYLYHWHLAIRNNFMNILTLINVAGWHYASNIFRSKRKFRTIVRCVGFLALLMRSSAQLMVLLIFLSSSSVPPLVNVYFKSLLLLQFLFDHSEYSIRETRHIVPPCNKNQNFKFLIWIPDFFKTLLLLQFLFDHSEFFNGETRHILVPPCNKARISNLEFQEFQEL